MPIPVTFLISEVDLTAVLKKLGQDWNMVDLKETVAETVAKGKPGDFFKLRDDVYGILRSHGRPDDEQIEIVLCVRPDTEGAGKKIVLSTL